MGTSSTREEALFADALAQPPAQRGSFLAQACGADTALLARIAALIAAHDGPESLMVPAPPRADLPAAGSANVDLSAAGLAKADLLPVGLAKGEAAVGDHIGRYKLLQMIGEGGCGVVWMAEQEEPVRRRVALKVIKLGMDTKAVVARFEAERQALAMMDHPCIAKVYDAGATETGRPYFVMELVRGIPITRYCDENHLTPNQRLELFIKACQAIQHAHQKGVIHRDIKPSNILVTVNDGAPTPKVIDFGIAKATQGKLTDATVFTAFEQFIGTPVYMSPEQAEMSSLDIDTRSDVYSLGVLLYELLTGKPPFDAKAFAQAGVDQIRRQIREVEPPRPSARLRTLDDDERTTIARLRGTAESQLSLALRGDLDWIVMRCIEKDRTRRYDTANGLAMDIQRYLRNEPVIARPPSTAYLLRKLIRRNRVAFGGGVLVAVVLVAGAAVSIWQAVRATQAERTQLRLRTQSERALERAVVAERNERKMREQAVEEAVARARSASRTDFKVGSRLLDQNKAAEGVAYLVRAARTDPQNQLVCPRLVSALAGRNFLLPAAAPLQLPAAVKWISPGDDDLVLVLAEDGVVRILDGAAERVIREFSFSKKVMRVALAAKNPAIFGVQLEDDSLLLCDMISGRPRGAAIKPPERLGSWSVPALSPDGRWLAAASETDVWVWDATSGGLRATLPHTSNTGRFEFSPDSTQIVTIAFRDYAQVWSVPDGKPLSAPLPSGSETRNATFTPDGRLFAVCSIAGDVALRDARTGHVNGPLLEHGSCTDLARFTPNGRRLITTGIDGTVKVWDVESGKAALPPLRHDGALDYHSAIAIDRSGDILLTTSGDGFTRVWDLGNGELLAEPFLQQDGAPCAALSRDGKRAYIGTRSGRVFSLRIERGATQPWRLPRTEAFVTAQFSATPPLRLAWATRDELKAFDVVSGKEAGGGVRFPEPITRASFLRADGRYMVVQTANQEVQAWEITSGEVHARHIEVSDSRSMYGFSAAGDRLWVTPWFGRNVRVWHLPSGRPISPLLQCTAEVYPISPSFSPDGNRLAAAAGDGTARIWDVVSGQQLFALQPLPAEQIQRVTFSPDGSRLATATWSGEVRLWDAVTGQPVSPVRHHRSRVDASAFSPDGRYFATSSQDGAVCVWSSQDGTAIGEPMYHSRYIQGLQFNLAGTRLASVSDDGVARVWHVETGSPLTEPMVHRGPMARLGDLGGREWMTFGSNGHFSPFDGRFLFTFSVNETCVWAIPPEVGEQPVPDWLLELATACAGKRLTDAGVLVDATDVVERIGDIRRTIAALPPNMPFVEWGRWIVADRSGRSIAPGFSFTAAEAERFASMVRATRP